MGELEKNIIIDYPLLGSKACMKKYNITYGKLRWFCEKYKLKVNKNTKSLISKNNANDFWEKRIDDYEYNVNEKCFINNLLKESVYLLGFIWGDGYITNKQIRIECVSDDIEYLMPVFERTGKWYFNKRIRKDKKERLLLY